MSGNENTDGGYEHHSELSTALLSELAIPVPEDESIPPSERLRRLDKQSKSQDGISEGDLVRIINGAIEEIKQYRTKPIPSNSLEHLKLTPDDSIYFSSPVETKTPVFKHPNAAIIAFSSTILVAASLYLSEPFRNAATETGTKGWKIVERGVEALKNSGQNSPFRVKEP